MSEKENTEDLLINFDNLAVNENASNANVIAQNSSDRNSNENNSNAMPFMCTAVPIYKLFSSNPNDLIENNNPFDQMDKQAALSDDPFEIVDNALGNNQLSDMRSNNVVKTGTLISLESPVNTKDDRMNTIEKHQIDEETNSVQNTSHNNNLLSSIDTPKKSMIVSPTGKNRAKPRSNPISLLKYSLSNNRLDENASPVISDDNFSSGDEILQKKLKANNVVARRDSNTDDSFDDIWSTKPNLVDSQTDIDGDSDIDSDIAILNIPMLNESKNCSILEESSCKIDSNEIEDTIEPRNVNRSELLEKLASIKQKLPISPLSANNIDLSSEQVNDKTIDVTKPFQQSLVSEKEPATPENQYSSILPQHQKAMSSNNPDSLIDNLKRFVDGCDDKEKQSEAKYLLDNLSSILTTYKETDCEEGKTNNFVKRKPIQRQGTFRIDKDERDAQMLKENNDSDNTVINLESSEDISDVAEQENSLLTSDFSDVVKQIQSALSTQQNINLLQQNMAASVQTMNPIILVIPQSNDVKQVLPNIPRARSQSLNLKEKPIAAAKAVQTKNETQQKQSTLLATPLRRPSLVRRSSFGTITRATANSNSNNAKAESTKPNPMPTKNTLNAPIMRRRSLQSLITNTKESEPIQPKVVNAVNRRRSFQGTSTSSSIRSPSPKSIPTIATNLARRKSFNNQTGAKNSPQILKSSHGIIKKPASQPLNLKIRVSQAIGARTTGTNTRSAPLKAMVPLNRVAPLLVNDSVSPIEESRGKSLITSTPRNVSTQQPSINSKSGKLQSI